MQDYAFRGVSSSSEHRTKFGNVIREIPLETSRVVTTQWWTYKIWVIQISIPMPFTGTADLRSKINVRFEFRMTRLFPERFEHRYTWRTECVDYVGDSMFGTGIADVRHVIMPTLVSDEVLFDIVSSLKHLHCGRVLCSWRWSSGGENQSDG